LLSVSSSFWSPVSLFVYLSISVFAYFLFVYWPVCLDLFCVCLFVSLRMTVFPFVYLFFYFPVSVFTCVSFFQSFNWPFFLLISLSVLLSFCLFFSFCPSDYLSRKSCHVRGDNASTVKMLKKFSSKYDCNFYTD
jgi:hypothetical protein